MNTNTEQRTEPLTGTGVFKNGDTWIPYRDGTPLHHPDGSPVTCHTPDTAMRYAGSGLAGLGDAGRFGCELSQTYGHRLGEGAVLTPLPA